MKIRCKGCGKRFDSDVYSGLCPKCGMYQRPDTASGVEMNGVSPEDAHRKLHEDYDAGYSAAHPTEEEIIDHFSPGKKGNGQTEVKKRRRHPVLFTAAVIVSSLIIVFAVRTVYLHNWKQGHIKELMTDIRTTVDSGSDHKLIFEGGPIEYPIEVTVLGAQLLELNEELLPQGKSVAVVKISASCEGYNSDVSLQNYYLKYEFDGQSRYKKPMSTYTLKKDPFRLGLPESELASEYSVMNKEHGYFFFLVEEGAVGLELYAAVNKSDSPAIVVQEGFIELSEVSKPGLGQE